MQAQTSIRLPDTSMTPPLACLLSAASGRQSIFTGKERDAESGNDYFGARYYASTMGRFMSPDWSAKVQPVPYAKLGDPQSLNLYVYVLNNPLSHVTQMGTLARRAIGVATHGTRLRRAGTRFIRSQALLRIVSSAMDMQRVAMVKESVSTTSR
jgi:RHS repeat-associated protein